MHFPEIEGRRHSVYAGKEMWYNWGCCLQFQLILNTIYNTKSNLNIIINLPARVEPLTSLSEFRLARSRYDLQFQTIWCDNLFYPTSSKPHLYHTPPASCLRIRRKVEFSGQDLALTSSAYTAMNVTSLPPSIHSLVVIWQLINCD